MLELAKQSARAGNSAVLVTAGRNDPEPQLGSVQSHFWIHVRGLVYCDALSGTSLEHARMNACRKQARA